MRIGRRGIFELSWALGMVAVVAAVFMPTYIRARGSAPSLGCTSSLKTVGTALEMYAYDNEHAFPDALEQLVPTYLKTLPTCPTVGRQTYVEAYTVAHGGTAEEAYTVVCFGNNHAEIRYPPNFPQYTSRLGLLGAPAHASPAPHVRR